MHNSRAAAAMAASLLALAAPAAAGEISPAAIKAEVTFLADDLLEGRALGSRGHEIAARQVASQFAAMGLVPAGTDGSWFQRINFAERSLDAPPATLVLTGAGGSSSTFTNGTELSVGPGTTAGSETAGGNLVFVGFGLQSPQLGIDDYAGLDVRGKVVVVLAGAPTGMNSEVGAHLGRMKSVFAETNGAIGLITVRTVAADARGPWSKTVAGLWRPRRVWVGPDGLPDTSSGSLKFEAALNNDAAAKLFAGSAQSFDAVRATAETASPNGFALPGNVKLTRATKVTTVSSPNVLARLPGSDPAVTDQVVLLSAHLDHLGMKPGGSGDTIYNGAMDNASGVATLIEVARSFATDKKAPRRSLLFLVTTGEESGLAGSSYFARHPTVGIDRIVSEVNLDMPILTCDFGDVVAYGADRSTMGPIVAAAVKKQGLKLAPDPQPTEALFTRSDHYPLVRAGVPSVFLKTGWHDTKGGLTCRDAEADFRKNRYHEPNDDLAQAIDWNVAAKFARINAEISRSIANAKDVPHWYAGDYFGDQFAPRAKKAVRPQ